MFLASSLQLARRRYEKNAGPLAKSREFF